MWNDEKDYIMRMIKEISRVVFWLMIGKQYVQVELEEQSKYQVARKDPQEYKRMVDHGEINEAENLLLDNINYSNKEEVVAAVLFYEYVGAQTDDFLTSHNYSKEEALDGMKQLAKEVGYDGIWDEF